MATTTQCRWAVGVVWGRGNTVKGYGYIRLSAQAVDEGYTHTHARTHTDLLPLSQCLVNGKLQDLPQADPALQEGLLQGEGQGE